MTGLAALTPLAGLRLDTTEEVGGDNISVSHHNLHQGLS